MGKRGPKPKPKALKVFAGNPNKRPLPDEPEPTGIPAKPQGLGKIASQAWDDAAKQLIPLKLLTDLDANAFLAYCHAWEDYLQAKSDVLFNGAYCVLDNGNSVISAPYRRMHMAFERLRRLQAEFGMTPASRSCLNVASGAGTADTLDDFRVG